MIDGLLLDIGGVLTQDGAALPGAIDAVAELQQRKLPLRFLTNTSKRPRQAVLDELVDLGFTLQAEQLITAPIAVKQLLQQQNLRPFLISTPALLDDFADIDTEQPNAVVVFDAAEGFRYQVLDAAFQVLQQGAPLIAVGENRYYQSGGSLHLDAGPFVKALEYAADVEAQIIGKPAATFFTGVAQSMGCDPASTLMVGDDIDGDVLGAQAAGLQAALVKTGKYRDGDEQRVDQSTMVLDTIADLPAQI